MLKNLALFGLRTPCLILLSVLLVLALTTGDWLELLAVLVGAVGGDLLIGKILGSGP